MTTPGLTTRGVVRVYLALSLDGFVAGEGGDLSFLDPPPPESGPGVGGEGSATDSSATMAEEAEGMEEFKNLLKCVGCMVMGRNTFDKVLSFGPDMWPYASTHIIVPTSRELPVEQLRESKQLHKSAKVEVCRNQSIGEILERAHSVANGGDIYLDGGKVVRDALEAGLVELLELTYMPVALGTGISLFGGLSGMHRFKHKEPVKPHGKSGAFRVTLVPRR
eukprot:GFYU01044824.1.p1 GENE.GFYU01044824.1~~GFYU01044824.1.p1  ORF type:complete len:221 (-),score=58.98 GFYU01044824.1:49-711(-)